RPGGTPSSAGCGGERGSEAAPAVEDDVGVVVGDRGLDVALEDPLAQRTRAGQVAARELLVLADVDQVEALAGVEPPPPVGDGAPPDARPRVVDQPQEARCVVHHQPSNAWRIARRRRDCVSRAMRPRASAVSPWRLLSSSISRLARIAEISSATSGRLARTMR